ncbi:MAG: DUF3857 and transglutaminase domain-containing protein [Alphaproteobacteria bacterium]|nr:DUF3857 and transglutaminase domain-containing protein [Alphaproteobacteria bacterium]
MRLLVLLALFLPAIAGAADWSEASAFEAPVADMLADGVQASEGSDNAVEVLLAETTIRIDAQGRETRSERLVYVVRQPDRATAWSATEAYWAPWHQDRPEIEVRVISPRGDVAWLDGSTLTEAGTHNGDPTMFADSKVLRGPLPHVVAGSLVEEVITIREHRPFTSAGASGSVLLGRMDATRRHVRVRVEAPSTARLQVAVAGFGDDRDGRVKTRRAGDVQVAEVDLRDIEETPSWRTDLPIEVIGQPFLRYSTIDGWQAAAQAYGARLDDRLDAAGLESLVDEVKTASGLDAIRIAVRGVQARLRYTGVEFGEQAIVPYSPKESLARGYGDCKDMATAVVAVLRAAGVDAEVALLATGSWTEGLTELPDPGRFNHAIVHVGKGDTWVDVTAPDVPIGELPSGDQGRMALLIRPNTKDLVRTPVQSSTFVETRAYDLREYGNPEIVESSTWQGYLGHDLRSDYIHASDDQITEWLENWSKRAYGTAEDLTWTTEGRDPDAPTFAITVSASNAERGITTLFDAALWAHTSTAVANVPNFDAELVEAAIEATKDERHPPRLRLRPFDVTATTTVSLPTGFELDTATAPVSVHLDHLTVDLTWDTSTPDRLAVSTHAVSDGQGLSLEEARTLSDQLDTPFLREETTLVARPKAVLLKSTDPVAGLRAGREAAERSEHAVLPWSSYAVLLQDVGLPDAAAAELERIAERYPTKPAFLRARAIVRFSSPWGEYSSAPLDRNGTLDDYEALLTVMPDDNRVVELAMEACVVGPDGSGKPDDAVLERCLALLDRVAAARKAEAEDADTDAKVDPPFRAERVTLLARLKRWEDVLAVPEADTPDDTERGLRFEARLRTAGLDAAMASIAALDKATRLSLLEAVGERLFQTNDIAMWVDLLERMRPLSSNPADIASRLAFGRSLLEGSSKNKIDADVRPIVGFFDILRNGGDPTSVLDVSGVDADQVEDGRKVAGMMPDLDDSSVNLDTLRTLFTILEVTSAPLGGGLREVHASFAGVGATFVYWTTGNDKRRRVRGAPDTLAGLGIEITDRIDDGRIEEAEAILDSMVAATGLEENPSPSTKLLLRAVQERAGGPDAAHLALLGHALAATGRQASLDAIPAMLPGTDPEVRVAVANYLNFHLKGRTEQALPTVDAALALQPDDRQLVYRRLYLLAIADVPAAVEAADAARAQFPKDPSIRDAAAHVAEVAGDFPGQIDLLKDACGRGDHDACNNTAWAQILSGHPEAAVDTLRPFALAKDRFDDSSLHTFVTALAASGHVDEALQRWRTRMLATESLGTHWWLVVGLLYEQLGWPELSRMAYGRIEEDRALYSTWSYAQRRLAALDGSP